LSRIETEADITALGRREMTAFPEESPLTQQSASLHIRRNHSLMVVFA
jgi:hypothetical protein